MLRCHTFQLCQWMIMAVLVSSQASKNTRQERDLMVVLPVLQGRNISGGNLQYVFTKKPITMLISDTQPTTHRPASTNPWPASFASKAKVFLVEPSVRRTSPNHMFYPEWVRHNIPTTSTQRPNYSSVPHLEEKVTAEPATTTPSQVPSNDPFNVSVSRVTWRKSTERTPVIITGETTATSPQSLPAEPTLDITTANFLQFNSSATNASAPDEKTVTQLALDLQASTNRLTNDIKSMLLHLGLLAQGPQLQGDSNELWTEGSENNSVDIGSSSYLQFKNIPVRDDLAIRDDMKQLLDTFGLLPFKNESTPTNDTVVRVKRNTREDTSALLLDTYESFSRTTNKSEKYPRTVSTAGKNRVQSVRPSKSISPGARIEKSTIKPRVSFAEQRRHNREQVRARAVNTGSSANKVDSKDGEPNSKGTASVDQLSGSFGGDTTDNQSTTPRQTNGLYFWVDWNSFFNLTGKPDVQLGYSSKAGDPTKFVPITDYRSTLGARR